MAYDIHGRKVYHELVVSLRSARELAYHVLEVADACGAPLPAYKTARRVLSVAEDHGGSMRDITGIHKIARSVSDLA